MQTAPELADGRVYDLLQAAGEQARAGIQALVRNAAEGVADAKAQKEPSARSAEMAEEIRRHLIHAHVASLPKAEVEALAGVLAKIPAAAQRFAGRAALASENRVGVDFSSALGWIEEISEVTIDMIRQLRGFDSLYQIKDLYVRLERMAERAETLSDEVVNRAYQGSVAPIHTVMVKDLGDRLQDIIDLYREGGGLMNQIAFRFY